MVASAVLNSQRKQIADLAVKSRLPAIYNDRQFVEAGGLMTYGVSTTDLDRRAATYVDKILKGAKPADLPVEQPKKFEFIINLKAAKQIGLTIPPNVLVRADKVIRVNVVSSQWSVVSKRIFSFALCAMLFALCFPARGAADRENLPHRFPGSKHCFR